MSTLTLDCMCLVLDASTVISLAASRRIDEILSSLPVRAAVIDITRRQEIRYIWGGPETNVRQVREPIDLQPLLDRRLLIEVELEEAEYITMVTLAARRLGNGESAATAVALHRGWGVCTDDYAAIPHLQQFAPSVPFVVTSRLLQHWATTTSATEADLRSVVQSMRLRAGFGQSSRDVLAGWLQQYLET
jgi:predicted nucleic acid-binding protein